MDFTDNISTQATSSAGRRRAAASRRRARQLTSTRKRRRLAHNLEYLLEAAEIPQVRRGSAVPVNRDEIRRCRALILGLALELDGDEPVTPRGVLMVRELLRDGSSPVYAGAPEGALELALRHARAALLLA
ncbi:MAG TPA: hypothetical protein VGF21_14435 [Thermoleophilaceae bacterium]